jgi:hypothetical protein
MPFLFLKRGSHEFEALNSKSNQFLPQNITPLVQPLDQGVIKAFKTNYRKLLLRHIINEFETYNTFDLKKVNVLDAINWASMACQK